MSAQFYRQLLALNVGGRFRALAVFPPNEHDFRQYLKSQGLAISDVSQEEFTSLGVHETPTLVIVNEAGKVKFLWRGKLSPEQEADVISRLGLDQAESATLGSHGVVVNDNTIDTSKLVTASELASLSKAGGGYNMPILDIRDRDFYASGHIVNSINIPIDELDVRASHELPRNRTILVYCHYQALCEAKKRTQGVQTFCALGHKVLTSLGFANVKFVNDDLYSLKEAGVGISAPELESSAAVR